MAPNRLSRTSVQLRHALMDRCRPPAQSGRIRRIDLVGAEDKLFPDHGRRYRGSPTEIDDRKSERSGKKIVAGHADNWQVTLCVVTSSTLGEAWVDFLDCPAVGRSLSVRIDAKPQLPTSQDRSVLDPVPGVPIWEMNDGYCATHSSIVFRPGPGRLWPWTAAHSTIHVCGPALWAT